MFVGLIKGSIIIRIAFSFDNVQIVTNCIIEIQQLRRVAGNIAFVYM